MELQKTIDSQYIQQHLANERTFLAWVRSSVTITGLGFLAAGVVFRSSIFERFGHWIAIMIGVLSILSGCFILAMGTRNYFLKYEGINNQTFRSPKKMISIVFTLMGLIDVLLIILLLIVLFY